MPREALGRRCLKVAGTPGSGSATSEQTTCRVTGQVETGQRKALRFHSVFARGRGGARSRDWYA